MKKINTILAAFLFLAVNGQAQQEYKKTDRVYYSKNYNLSRKESHSPAFQSTLPILVIDTKGKAIPDLNKIVVDFGIIYHGPGNVNNSTDPKNEFDGKVEIDLHGASSNYYSPKKSYGIKIVTSTDANLDTSILGLPREHSFILCASYFDKTFLRNFLAHRLYGGMGNYSSRTRFVELMLNGEYQGIYLLEEKIKKDKNRVDIAKLKPTDIDGNNVTGGYIIKIDRINGNGGQGWYSKYKKDAADSTATFIQFDYPSYDSLVDVQRQYIKSYVDSFEDALAGSNFKDPNTGYRHYIDVKSFLDKFLINELSKNVDGYRLSEYLYKDKTTKKKQGLLFEGPDWDYDIAFANANFGNSTAFYKWQFEEKEGTYYSPMWWRRLMQDQWFRDELYCEYKNLRQTVLTENYIYGLIDSAATALKAPLDRNFARWPVLGDTLHFTPTPVPKDYAGEIQVLKQWVKDRIYWMDKNINGMCHQVITGIAGSSAGQLSIYPNPFSSDVKIAYSLAGNGPVKVEIFNTVGMRVYLNEKSEPQAGNHTQEISLKALPTGIYIIRLTAGGTTLNEKLMKVKE